MSRKAFELQIFSQESSIVNKLFNSFLHKIVKRLGMLIKEIFCQILVEMIQFLADCKKAAIIQLLKDQLLKKRLDFFRN